MSQFGMQMPGTRMKRGASPDVYTALAVFAAAFLVGALAVMWTAATKVGKGGSPFELQDPAKIELAAPAK
ncbi:MAG: hypothetical protein ACOYN0_14570 [Phycisphaerales bacterium]